MSDLWEADCTRWWLPSNEGYPPILRSIREFIDYRSQRPQDTATEDLRDMKGLFHAMKLDDSEIKDTSSVGTGSSDHVEFGPDGFLQWESSPDVNWT